MLEKISLELFIEDMKDSGKICLKGKYWDRLFGMITECRKHDNSILPNPLILCGWHCSGDEEKKERFLQHLKCAYENNRWLDVLRYISLVPERAWYFAK